MSVDYYPLKTLSLSLSVTEVAISPSNNEVHIYAKKGSKWEVEHVLSEHGQRVTGMDWAKKSDRLVTCGAVSPFISLSLSRSLSLSSIFSTTAGQECLCVDVWRWRVETISCDSEDQPSCHHGQVVPTG